MYGCQGSPVIACNALGLRGKSVTRLIGNAGAAPATVSGELMSNMSLG